MKRFIPIRKTIYDCCEYLLVLSLILSCRSIWTTIPSMGWFNNATLLLMGVSVFGCLVCCEITTIQLHKCTLSTIIVVVFASVFYLISRFNLIGFMKLIITLFFSLVYFYFCYRPNNDGGIWYKYSTIVSIIAIISLLFWLFGSILNIIHSTHSVFSSWTGNDSLKTVPSYFNLYFETQKGTILGLGRYSRNTAIFTEAPMASFHFSLAFLIELLLRQKPRTVRVFLLAITIITTTSTTGYVVLISALGYVLITSKSQFLVFQLLQKIIIPLSILLGGIILYTLIQNKLATIYSGAIRVDDFRAGFLAWLHHPIFGSGYNNTNYIKGFMSSFRKHNMGFSNSPMMILANGGIYLTIPYISAFIIGIQKALQSVSRNQLVFVLEVLFMFVVTIVVYQPLTIMLLLGFSFLDRSLAENEKTRLN